jgi:hypothetical protein
MVAQLLYTCGVFFLLFTVNASAQDRAEARPDAEKKFRIFGEKDRLIFGPSSILPQSRDCVDAKIEVTVRNGVATFSLKEIETVPDALNWHSGPDTLKWHSGQGKIEFILGTGNCRISIRAVPAE